MKRVMIVGGPGSGKSTLARALGAQTGLPVFHMDLIHWQENWVQRPLDEKTRLAQEIEQKDRWIFEGGMSVTYGSRLQRADTLIWLDLPVGLRLWRVTKRLFQHLGRNRPDLPKGCTEGLHIETLRFYHFIWTSRHSSRDKIAALLETPRAGQSVVHLRSRADVAGWLAKAGR